MSNYKVSEDMILSTATNASPLLAKRNLLTLSINCISNFLKSLVAQIIPLSPAPTKIPFACFHILTFVLILSTPRFLASSLLSSPTFFLSFLIRKQLLLRSRQLQRQLAEYFESNCSSNSIGSNI